MISLLTFIHNCASFLSRNLADACVARQQTAGRYLHALSEAGILREIPSGREKLYLNHRLLWVLCDGADDWEPFNIPSA
jgi:hypothetical protein